MQFGVQMYFFDSVHVSQSLSSTNHMGKWKLSSKSLLRLSNKYFQNISFLWKKISSPYFQYKDTPSGFSADMVRTATALWPAPRVLRAQLLPGEPMVTLCGWKWSFAVQMGLYFEQHHTVLFLNYDFLWAFRDEQEAEGVSQGWAGFQQ